MCWTCDKESDAQKPPWNCAGCGREYHRNLDRCVDCGCPHPSKLRPKCGHCGKLLPPGEKHVANPGLFPWRDIKCFVLLNLGDIISGEPTGIEPPFEKWVPTYIQGEWKPNG